MPQMYPLMWFSLFSMTTLALIVVMSTVHFSYQDQKEGKKTVKVLEGKNLVWKW